MFQKRDNSWIQEFTSLSNGPLTAESRAGLAWRPSRGGVEFKPAPGAPRPAATPDQRFRQIRAIVEDFAVDDFERNMSWQRLRRLSKPFLRYGNQDCNPSDGACSASSLQPTPRRCSSSKRGARERRS